MPFGWCLCALFIELSSLHLQKRITIGRDFLPHGATDITCIRFPSLPPVYLSNWYVDLVCFLMFSGDLDVLSPFEQLLIH